MKHSPYRGHPYREVAYLLNSRPGPLHHAPLAFAHRGADPQRENTMAAFRRAVQLGYQYLEVDVRTSADGELVVFHDETLDRITDGSGKLHEKTWAHLAHLRVVGAAAKQTARRTAAGELTDTASAAEQAGAEVGEREQPGAEEPAQRPDRPGEPLARFEQLLSEFPDTHFNVDLKDAASVEHFARIVEDAGAHHRVLAASFNDARRHRVRRLLSRPTATSGGWVSTALFVLLGPLGFMRRLGSRLTHIDCVQVPIQRGRIRIVTRQFVERCHRAGLQVHVWVIDDPAQMHYLLDLGVDGLMTDDAEALAAVMRERSVWPQNR